MTQANPKDLLQSEADFLASGVEMQAQAIALLLAEMRALSAVLPGAEFDRMLRGGSRVTTEADFDNMPV